MADEQVLSYLNDEDRLNAYNAITKGCSHIYSKGKLQEDRLDSILDTFANLAENDPIFLAHFTSYVTKKLESKDLKVVSTFMNSLSDADGTPLRAGSKYKKPNLRIVSQAAFQELDPKLALRVLELANLKKKIGKREVGTHYNKHLRTAITRYIRFREMHLKAIEGILKSGLRPTFKKLYRYARIAPSQDVINIFNWKQKKGDRVPEVDKKKDYFNFKGMSDIEIAEKIRKEKLPPTGVLGALPKKISPVIAASILEQATGNQAVILRETFDKEGLLKDKEVMEVFKNKIKTAKTALDRVDKITTEVDEEVKKVLKSARSEKRKEDWDDSIGSVYVHIDKSGSMDMALDLAIECGAIIAECVNNPKENFHWGLFDGRGYDLESKKPDIFEKEAFEHALYGYRAVGSTDCLGCYQKARQYGCNVDIYITDQGHNYGDIATRIRDYTNKGILKPSAAVVVDTSNGYDSTLKDGLEAVSIPVTVVAPETLKESALITQAIKTAMKGAIAVVDEIMETPLLELPKWWCSI